ncbi:hypothetical protein RRG08_042534 [Elysia crispata]|uniref:Uncharacterized protein n=1 Tax=Elysia crispata TaxID=231223 RepID=A0AAE0XPX2_9GAST|nr:hypothetical protein RRG08_042534 [Elysia crispata]
MYFRRDVIIIMLKRFLENEDRNIRVKSALHALVIGDLAVGDSVALNCYRFQSHRGLSGCFSTSNDKKENHSPPIPLWPNNAAEAASPLKFINSS